MSAVEPSPIGGPRCRLATTQGEGDGREAKAVAVTVLALQTFLEERAARGAEIISLVLLSQQADTC